MPALPLWGDVPLGRMERAAGLAVSPSLTRDRTRGCCAGEVVTAVNRASDGCMEGVTCQITTRININVNANIAHLGRVRWRGVRGGGVVGGG